MLEVILIILILVGLAMNSMRRPKNFPPGPIPLPIVGSFHILDHQTPQNTMDAFHKIYGPYAGMILGSYKAIILSGWKAVMEGFTNEDLLGRPDVCLIRDRFDGDNYGVLFTDGDEWKTQRRFTIHHFRNLGFGRKNHELLIQQEAEELVEFIGGMNGKSFHLEDMLSTTVINIMWVLIGGKRYSHLDQQAPLLAARIKDCIHNIKMFGSIAIGFPFLRYIFPEQTGYASLKRGSKGLQEFVQKAIREHSLVRDKNNPRDFIDAYLGEIEKPDSDPTFSELQLEGICMDLLCAGGDTSISVMSFSILFLCLRKDLQDKLYEEIVEHLGTNRLPTADDRIKLVQTEAVLMEVLRMRSPAPTAIPHRALKNTTLGAYNVPKDTLIIMNINSILMDKEYWTDPEEFRPSRFLTKDGKIRRDERLIAFGKGKRACIGESLAKASSFIILTSLIQRFSFSFDPDLDVPQTEGVPGFTIAAPFFKVVATPRNNTISREMRG